MKRIKLLVGVTVSLALAWMLFRSCVPKAAALRLTSSTQPRPSVAPPASATEHTPLPGVPVEQVITGSEALQLARDSDEASIGTLITQLLAETDPEKRGALRRALASVTNAARVESLLDYLTHSNDPDVAHGIQLALATMATPVITRRLGFAYNNVTSDEAAVRIATAVEWTRSALCLPVLAEFLNAPDVPLQDRLSRASLRAITNLGTPYSVTILATRMELATGEDAALLAGAMAQIRGGGTEHELIAVAQGLRPETSRLETRLAAIKALGNYPLSLTQQALEGLSADAEPQVAATSKAVLLAGRKL